MPASTRPAYDSEAEPIQPRPLHAHRHAPAPLDALSALGSVEIETSLLASLSSDLHMLFDPVSEGVLPIYFGPLLGRLYLEGL